MSVPLTVSASNSRYRLACCSPSAICLVSLIAADPILAESAEAHVDELRATLPTVCLEPFADLTPKKRQAILRRLERIVKGVIADWKGQSICSGPYLKDLADRANQNKTASAYAIEVDF